MDYGGEWLFLFFKKFFLEIYNFLFWDYLQWQKVWEVKDWTEFCHQILVAKFTEECMMCYRETRLS